MSLTEMTQRGEEFERMPPHDVAAEQCVLGGMLLSKDAISDVIEVIRPTDHYRPDLSVMDGSVALATQMRTMFESEHAEAIDAPQDDVRDQAGPGRRQCRSLA